MFKCLKESEIEKVEIENIHDKRLISHIAKGDYKTILFTDGGILKDETLNIPGVSFIHIHPGIVPEVRGADCLHWSYLLKGKGGYSVFYMNAGIDTGDILIKEEYEITFKGIDISNNDNESLYSSILTYYEPCLRIKTLIKLVESTIKNQQSTCLHDLPCEKQDPNEGRMYFFMHKSLRDIVIDKIKKA